MVLQEAAAAAAAAALRRPHVARALAQARAWPWVAPLRRWLRVRPASARLPQQHPQRPEPEGAKRSSQSPESPLQANFTTRFIAPCTTGEAHSRKAANTAPKSV